MSRISMLRNKVTNRSQFVSLVDSMEMNPELATGALNDKTIGKTLWEEIVLNLNALGPPVRDCGGWQKVWKDYKFKIKKKVLHNIREASAGGDTSKLYAFSAIEEAVINLLQLDRRNSTADGDGSRVTEGHELACEPPVGIEATVYKSEMIETDDFASLEEGDNSADVGGTQPTSQESFYISLPSTSRHPVETPTDHERASSPTHKKRKRLLQIEKNTTDAAYYLQQIYKVLDEKLRLYREEVTDRREYRKRKLELRIQMLEYKRNKRRNY